MYIFINDVIFKNYKLFLYCNVLTIYSLCNRLAYGALAFCSEVFLLFNHCFCCVFSHFFGRCLCFILVTFNAFWFFGF